MLIFCPVAADGKQAMDEDGDEDPLDAFMAAAVLPQVGPAGSVPESELESLF